MVHLSSRVLSATTIVFFHTVGKLELHRAQRTLSSQALTPRKREREKTVHICVSPCINWVPVSYVLLLAIIFTVLVPVSSKMREYMRVRVFYAQKASACMCIFYT
jgi:hypothetical protein